MTIYRTKQGDTWDSITHQLIGDTNLTGMLMAANPQYADIFIFSADVLLDIPEWDNSALDISQYPPWKRDD